MDKYIFVSCGKYPSRTSNRLFYNVSNPWKVCDREHVRSREEIVLTERFFFEKNWERKSSQSKVPRNPSSWRVYVRYVRSTSWRQRQSGTPINLKILDKKDERPNTKNALSMVFKKKKNYNYPHTTDVVDIFI